MLFGNIDFKDEEYHEKDDVNMADCCCITDGVFRLGNVGEGDVS